MIHQKTILMTSIRYGTDDIDFGDISRLFSISRLMILKIMFDMIQQCL